jgi:hypothetical protein
MKMNLELGPIAYRAEPAENKNFWSVQTFIFGVLLQGIKHGQVVMLSRVEVKSE